MIYLQILQKYYKTIYAAMLQYVVIMTYKYPF